MANVPEKIINFQCFVDGSTVLAGMVDATLPDIQFMTESIEGAGIAGVIESITLGHTDAMSMSLNFRTQTDQNLSFTAPKCYALELRGALQETDPSTKQIAVVPVTIAVRAWPKKVGLGKMAVAKTTDTNNEFTVDFIKVTRKGKTHIEIDKLNMKHIVDGTDYLAEVRAAMGKN
ncbi:phage major tail tube protein [Cetobacterium sp. ZOR0034]|uniref:phage major tail tube protein n=1 Tax=Cetobacterium sp. ZOR0034 TaxID=1339239 RepID=UPI000647BDDA|nr:phage major tail tube protein [Cetobacterium sp. ZOR0034]